MPEYVYRTMPGPVTVRVQRPGGTTRVRTRLATAGGTTTADPGVTQCGLLHLTNLDVSSPHPFAAFLPTGVKVQLAGQTDPAENGTYVLQGTAGQLSNPALPMALADEQVLPTSLADVLEKVGRLVTFQLVVSGSSLWDGVWEFGVHAEGLSLLGGNVWFAQRLVSAGDPTIAYDSNGELDVGMFLLFVDSADGADDGVYVFLGDNEVPAPLPLRLGMGAEVTVMTPESVRGIEYALTPHDGWSRAHPSYLVADDIADLLANASQLLGGPGTIPGPGIFSTGAAQTMPSAATNAGEIVTVIALADTTLTAAGGEAFNPSTGATTFAVEGATAYTFRAHTITGFGSYWLLIAQQGAALAAEVEEALASSRLLADDLAGAIAATDPEAPTAWFEHNGETTGRLSAANPGQLTAPDVGDPANHHAGMMYRSLTMVTGDSGGGNRFGETLSSPLDGGVDGENGTGGAWDGFEKARVKFNNTMVDSGSGAPTAVSPALYNRWGSFWEHTAYLASTEEDVQLYTDANIFPGMWIAELDLIDFTNGVYRLYRRVLQGGDITTLDDGWQWRLVREVTDERFETIIQTKNWWVGNNLNGRTAVAEVFDGWDEVDGEITPGAAVINPRPEDWVSGPTLTDSAGVVWSLNSATVEVAGGPYQPLDADLTAIAALTTTSHGRSLLTGADAAASRTTLGLGTAATSAATAFQSSDQDLTDIAGLSPTNDDFLQRKSGAWTNRTPAQVRSDLGLGMRLIADRTIAAGGSPSESFDVTGFTFVQIMFAGNTERNATQDNLRMTFNNNTGSVYSTDAGAMTTSFTIASVPGSQTNTDRLGWCRAEFHLLNGFMKNGWSIGATSLVSTSTTGSSFATRGLFSSITAAVTSVQLFSNLADIAGGSRIVVLGV